MKLFTPLIFLFVFHFSDAQSINRKQFFERDSSGILFISTNLKNIDNPQQIEVKRPGSAKLVYAKDSSFEGKIELHARGKSRFIACDPPPLMLYFKTGEESPLSKLGKLKLVWACSSTDYYDQLILREYLIYKMFNIITPYSFRVRLLDVQVNDSSKSGKLIKRKGFLIENIDDLAKRVNCTELQDTMVRTVDTDPLQYALVAIFQYMIANTDWSVANYQNVKLMVHNGTERKPPLVVPYDFDYSGLVNAEYAQPHESLPIDNVRVRYNKATSLRLEDIHAAAQIISNAKPAILSLIENMQELKPGARKDMTNYLNEFFRIMKDEKEFDNIFLKK